MKYVRSLWFLVIAVGLVITGCSGPKTITKNTPIQDIGAPAWVVKGGGAYGGEKGRAFYGVGSAVNIQNASLLRSAADNKARNEVAKVFRVYTASLEKGFNESTSAGQANVSSEEQDVKLAIKTFTAMTLSGVEIVDHWQRADTGEFFSLARLDLEAVKNNLDRAKELNSRVRDYIRQNAEKMHDELEKEEEKAKAGN